MSGTFDYIILICVCSYRVSDDSGHGAGQCAGVCGYQERQGSETGAERVASLPRRQRHTYRWETHLLGHSPVNDKQHVYDAKFRFSRSSCRCYIHHILNSF